MACSRSNLRMFAQRIAEADVCVCPDNTLLPFLIFISHWKKVPLLSNMHTNFGMVLKGGSFVARHVAAPIMDTLSVVCSHLAALTFTTSPSYQAVLDKRGARVSGVFSPRIKLGVFETEDSEETIAEARKWLTGGVDR